MVLDPAWRPSPPPSRLGSRFPAGHGFRRGSAAI